jgi:hypothetical protein
MSALDELETFCSNNEIPCRREDPRLAFQLKGERKLTIGIVATLGETHLRFESFFMRRPQEHQDAFHQLLLQRNLRARGVAFALDTDGDAFLVASLPVSAVDQTELDRVVGGFLVESDGNFDTAMKIGFATYLEADLAWRAKQGQPPKSD